MPPKKSSSSSRSEPMPDSTSGNDGTDGTETPVTGDGGSPGTTVPSFPLVESGVGSDLDDDELFFGGMLQ